MEKRVPTAELRFLTVDEILRIHEAQIAAGGPENEPGIMGLGPVNDAVDRAHHGPFQKRKPDYADRAAFYLRGTAQEHPFVQGNKRTAFEAVDVFLRLNGRKMKISLKQGEEFLLRVAGKELAATGSDEPVSIEEMAERIRENSEKL